MFVLLRQLDLRFDLLIISFVAAFFGAGLYNAAFDPRLPSSGGNDPRMPYPGGNQLRPVNSFTAQPSVASQPATSALSPEKSPTEKLPAAVEKSKDTVDESSKAEED